MKPLWDGEIVYNETLMFVGDEEAPLLYTATDIISVTSYSLDKEYVEGIDYYFDKSTNSIVRTATSEMPWISEDEYYPVEKTAGKAFDCTRTDHKYILFSDWDYISKQQVAVTYRHSGQNHITKPQSQKEAFARTIVKLQNNEPVKILFYGDSITVGGNSSGRMGIAPYADIWPVMVFNSLVNKYSATNAVYLNNAVSGWSSDNARSNCRDKVLADDPDAVFIAFGMNDTKKTVEEHIKNIRSIIEMIWRHNENTDICLVSTMLPNAEVEGFYYKQDLFADAYFDLVEEYIMAGKTNICVADVTSVHKEILQTKRYFDTTGNNVNHNNDFTARVYAQTVFQTICGD